jgi:Flp pilus assembly protein TadD
MTSRGLLMCRLLLFALIALSGATAWSQSEYPGVSGSSQSEDRGQSASQEAEAGSSHPTDPMLIADEALAERGDYASAANHILGYISSHAGSADAHFLLGYVLYRENKPQDSLAEYTLGAHFRKPDANNLAVVAMDYILLKDYGDADKWLSLATAWRPANALYWYYLGRTKYNENSFQEAVDAFKKCLTLHPQDVRAEYNLGLSYVGLDRDSDAVSAYQTAIAWQQNAAQQDPQPYLDLGMLLLQQGHPDQATSYLQSATTFGARNPRVHEQLGRTYEELHDLAGAESEIGKAILLAPKTPALHFEMGRIYQKEGLTAKARDEFAQCAALNATQSTDSAETPNPDY